MPRGRTQTYHPKVRGCYQCSQRRINCDRANPSCKKCVVRGLECSGYGTRYRFQHDLAAQGKAPGGLKQQPWDSLSHSESRPTISNIYGSCLDVIRDRPEAERQVSDCLESATDSAISGRNSECLNELVCEREAYVPESDRIAIITYDGPVPCSNTPLENLYLTHSLDTIDACSRYLLLLFSERVAPQLILIDDDFNGWRCLVLPVAYGNELVREAVMLISVSMIPVQHTRTFGITNHYARVTYGLRQKQDLLAEDTLGKQCVILTLLLLLVASGTAHEPSDFRAILRLLNLSIQATRNDENVFSLGELGTFLAMEVEKFRGYASPFLSRHEGTTILRQTTSERPPLSRGWDEFIMYCGLYENLNHLTSTLYEISVKACSIYLARVQAAPGSQPFTDMVEDFRQALTTLPSDCPGAQLVVWPTFLVAMESSDTEQREFFSQILLKQYSRTGFANILHALELLKRLWAEPNSGDWVERLTNVEVFVF